MKKLFSFLVLIVICNLLFSQTPQSFQYQAVVRDMSGTVLVNQAVNFQISIISGSVSGTVEYVETHSSSTNAFGIVTLSIGSGTLVSGNFSGISWGSNSYFVKVEADPSGGTSYLDMGTTQLLSVPYALYAESAGNAGLTYTAGTGISIAGSVITNDSPDQIVNINAGTGVQVTGSYPNFTIENTSPDQSVNLTGTGATTITGVYPNFTINSTDNNTTYTAGSGLNLTGTTFSNTAPDQTVNLTQGGATTITGTYPNFTISSTDNNTTYSAGSGLNLTGTTFSNTAPDQPITLTQGGATTITGTYPNFTISSTDNNTTYTAGSGISIAGTTISNASPNATHTGDVTGATALTIANNAVTTVKIADGNVTAAKLNNMSATNGQVLKFNGTSWAPAPDANTTYTAGSGLSLAGTTFSNTAPDQTVSLTQGGSTTISGTYPNFTISSTDLNTGTPGGLNKTVQFNNGGSFGGDTAMTWDNTNKRLGVGLTNPNGRMVIRGSATAPATEPLFEVKDASGHTVFVVYPDSVHIYVKDGGSKANAGGFAVSGRNAAKAVTDNYLIVTPDSTRIFTGDTISGFGVENLGSGTSTSYMHLTPTNYFIGHQAGDAITSGKFNSFFGYQCGLSNTGGNYNVFSGYKSGYSNVVGNYNTFLGYKTGLLNTGSDNTFLGFEAGSSHLSGGGNVYLGSKAGQNDQNGQQNVFIGENAGAGNISGQQNIFMGYNSGYSNNNGSYNVFLGTETGYTNSTGGYNTLIGYKAGRLMNSYYNLMIGYFSGMNTTTGSSNVFLGSYAGFANTTGGINVFIGTSAGYNNLSGTNNIFIGEQSGYSNLTASGNIFVGRDAGYYNKTGWGNLFLGNMAGQFDTTGSTNVYLGIYSGQYSQGNNNVCVGPNTNQNNNIGNYNTSVGNSAGQFSSGNYNLFLGYYAGYNNTGSNNVFLGYNSGFNDVGSNKFYVENSSNTFNPLLNGDFQNDRLAIHRQADTYPFQVGTGTSNGNGAFLTGGGVWTAGSSRGFKDRFVDLDGKDILSKISAMELKGWYYKGTEEYHIGPFAEDFYNAFGTGVLDVKEDLGKYISATDVSGVSLIAIKELIKQNENLQKQVDELREELRKLYKE